MRAFITLYPRVFPPSVCLGAAPIILSRKVYTKYERKNKEILYRLIKVFLVMVGSWNKGGSLLDENSASTLKAEATKAEGACDRRLWHDGRLREVAAAISFNAAIVVEDARGRRRLGLEVHGQLRRVPVVVLF